MSDVTHILICAAVLMDNPAEAVRVLPTYFEQEPRVVIRAITDYEKTYSRRGAETVGMFYPYGPGSMVAEDWPALVHEACHYLQWRQGETFRGDPSGFEPECERVQVDAYKCPGARY